MSGASTESRRYHVQRKMIDGEHFVQVAVFNDELQLVTRDHFSVDEARSLAAEMVLAVEG